MKMNAILVVLLIGCVACASATKSWSQLSALFPGQPGQPKEYLGSGTFQLAPWAIQNAVDGSDARAFYDESFLLKFTTPDDDEVLAHHILYFLVNYQDQTEFGSILYAASPFANNLETSVVLDARNRPLRSAGCLWKSPSLPDIFQASFWSAVTASTGGMVYQGERYFNGIRCDYFEGIIPGDGASIPNTPIGWFNRYSNGDSVTVYSPLNYFLGPASFTQTKGYPNPSNDKVRDALTRAEDDSSPSTGVCSAVTDAFLATGALPSTGARSVARATSELEAVYDYLLNFY